MQEFYGKEDTERALGPEEYRAVVFDDSPMWEVDIQDIGKYGGKWYVLHASGCSCWGGEYSLESGPFDSLKEVEKYIHDEYAKVETDYYTPMLRAWAVAFTNAYDFESEE